MAAVRRRRLRDGPDDRRQRRGAGELMARRLIVTGAGSGIGAATSARAAEAGWSVVGIDRAFPVDSGPAGHNRFTVDVTEPAAVSAAVDAACAEWDAAPDALVHCAGIYRVMPSVAADVAAWDRHPGGQRQGQLSRRAGGRGVDDPPRGNGLHRVARFRRRGAWGSRRAERRLRGQQGRGVGDGTPTRGRVGRRGNPGQLRGARRHRHGHDHGDRGRRRDGGTAATATVGAAGTADEVAAACLFLAGSDSSYITGTEITVDGGYLAS